MDTGANILSTTHYVSAVVYGSEKGILLLQDKKGIWGFPRRINFNETVGATLKALAKEINLAGTSFGKLILLGIGTQGTNATLYIFGRKSRPDVRLSKAYQNHLWINKLYQTDHLQITPETHEILGRALNLIETKGGRV